MMQFCVSIKAPEMHFIDMSLNLQLKLFLKFHYL